MYKIYRVSINSFTDYKHLLQENYCTWKTNFLFFKYNSRILFTTHHYTPTCAPFVARWTSNRQSISLHVFSNMSSVTVAKASVILALPGVENSVHLTYPHKKKSRGGGWYQAIVVARVSDHLSQSTCLEILHPKPDEHVNPSVEVHHLVGKLSTAETLLRYNVKFSCNKCL